MKLLVQKTKCIIAMIAVVMMTSMAFASNVPDSSKTGSISISLVDHVTGKVIPGGEIEVIKVADIDFTNAEYVFTAPFASCSITLGDFSDSKLSDKLAKYIEDNAIAGTKYAIDDNGKVTVKDLSLGAYVVKQTKSSAGFFPFNTFLVTVPILENDVWVYNVDATPKMDPTKAMSPTPTATPTVTPNPSGPSITPGNSSSTDQSTPTPTPPEKLPQTGQLKWPVPVFAFAGLVTFILGWFVFVSEDEDDKK